MALIPLDQDTLVVLGGRTGSTDGWVVAKDAIPDLPKSCLRVFAATLDGGILRLTGGHDGSTSQKKTYTLNLAADQPEWLQQADLPEARHWHAATRVRLTAGDEERRDVVVGGYGANCIGTLGTLALRDPDSGEWTSQVIRNADGGVVKVGFVHDRAFAVPASWMEA